MPLKKRLIPVLLLRDSKLVQSRRFARYNVVGSPEVAVRRINSWSADELLYLDISENSSVKGGGGGHESRLELLQKISEGLRLPLAFGGKIRSVSQASDILASGADKIVINTPLFEQPETVKEISETFGSQAVVGSIDFGLDNRNSYRAHAAGGSRPTHHGIESAIDLAVVAGCGEILINSIDRDGTGQGFDLVLIQRAARHSPIPVIAMGGAGSWEDFVETVKGTDASAIAAANIFHHSENSVFECKNYLYQQGLPFRAPPLLSVERRMI